MRQSTADIETATRSADLAVERIGFRRGVLWIVLRDLADDEPAYVVELHGVYKYFDLGVIGGQPVAVSCLAEPGSYGWEMTPEQRASHKELHVTLKADVTENRFRAIAERVVCLRFDVTKDVNLPE